MNNITEVIIEKYIYDKAELLASMGAVMTEKSLCEQVNDVFGTNYPSDRTGIYRLIRQTQRHRNPRNSGDDWNVADSFVKSVEYAY